MTILLERPHQPIFQNEILAIQEDTEYHLRIVEENNNQIQQLTDAQNLMLQSLGLGEEAIAQGAREASALLILFFEAKFLALALLIFLRSLLLPISANSLVTSIFVT